MKKPSQMRKGKYLGVNKWQVLFALGVPLISEIGVDKTQTPIPQNTSANGLPKGTTLKWTPSEKYISNEYD